MNYKSFYNQYYVQIIYESTLITNHFINQYYVQIIYESTIFTNHFIINTMYKSFMNQQYLQIIHESILCIKSFYESTLSTKSYINQHQNQFNIIYKSRLITESNNTSKFKCLFNCQCY